MSKKLLFISNHVFHSDVSVIYNIIVFFHIGSKITINNYEK